MTEKEAISQAKKYNHLIGERWKSQFNGEIETIIEINPLEIKKQETGWTVIILFTPQIQNHIGEVRGCLLETFLKIFTKI
jgi:transketolase N-terminal domain/subunit